MQHWYWWNPNVPYNYHGLHYSRCVVETEYKTAYLYRKDVVMQIGCWQKTLRIWVWRDSTERLVSTCGNFPSEVKGDACRDKYVCTFKCICDFPDYWKAIFLCVCLRATHVLSLWLGLGLFSENYYLLLCYVWCDAVPKIHICLWEVFSPMRSPFLGWLESDLPAILCI